MFLKYIGHLDVQVGTLVTWIILIYHILPEQMPEQINMIPILPAHNAELGDELLASYLLQSPEIVRK
jgi:hypothetical protein